MLHAGMRGASAFLLRVGEGFIPPGELVAAGNWPGRIYASPTSIPGMFVGAAYMPPGMCAAAGTSAEGPRPLAAMESVPGGMNPSPTTRSHTPSPPAAAPGIPPSACGVHLPLTREAFSFWHIFSSFLRFWNIFRLFCTNRLLFRFLLYYND